MHNHHLPFPPQQEDLDHVARLFQALSDPTRLTLLLALQDGELSVTSLVTLLNQPQSTVSRHLATLKHAGLVESMRMGNKAIYRISDSHLSGLLQEAFSHAEHQRLGLDDHPGQPQVTGGIH